MQFELDSDLGVVAGHVRSLDPLNLTPRLWHPFVPLPLHFFLFSFQSAYAVTTFPLLRFSFD